MKTDNLLLRQASRGAGVAISGATVSRLSTFAGNVLLVRLMADPEPLGVSSVHFHLFYSTSLSLAREGVRRAVLRNSCGSTPEQAVQVSKAYSLVGLAVFAPLGCAYFASGPPPPGFSRPEYLSSLALVLCAICLELACEPLVVYAVARFDYKTRSSLDALSSVARVLASLAAYILLGWKLQAFALGYLVASLVLCAGYSTRFGVSLVLRAPMDRASPLAKDAWAMSLQAAWKLVLAEGENGVMLALHTLPADQGAFALAANLGSLVARLVLQPCEEAAYAVFGRLEAKQRDRVLGGLARGFCMFGLFFAVFASQYCHLLILLLYSRTLADETETPSILAWYCFYVGFMAFNGVSEAFVQALMDDEQMLRFNLWLGMCSWLFLALAWGLVPWFSTSGLVLANCLVMAVRSMRNVYFAKVTCGSHAAMFPSASVWLAFGAAAGLIRVASREWYANGEHWAGIGAYVGFGAVLGLMCLLVCAWSDAELVALVREQFQANKHD